MCGPLDIDNPAPPITVMLPDEDWPQPRPPANGDQGTTLDPLGHPRSAQYLRAPRKQFPISNQQASAPCNQTHENR